MQSSRAVTAGFAAVTSALVWISVVAAGLLENSGGEWARSIRIIFFRNDSHVLMEKWAIDISLPKWSLCIWEFVYTWNTLWAFYCVGISCRAVPCKISEEYTLCTVNVFPPLFHCLWSFSGISHLCWLFFWDREILVGSVFFQAFVVTACIACLYISYRSVERNGAILQVAHPWDLWVCRALIQNGIVMLGTWSCILLLINMACVLTHEGGVPSYLTSVAALGALACILLGWFILDTFVFDRWVRYTFSVYPTISWASLAILLRHFQPWSHVTIMTLAILVTSLLILVIRVPLVVWRSFSSPLYIKQTLPHTTELIVDRQEQISTISSTL